MTPPPRSARTTTPELAEALYSADQAADLSPLAGAARQAGLDQQEITRTLNSARRTSQARIEPHDPQAEGEH
jgi:hypothetical protein